MQEEFKNKNNQEQGMFGGDYSQSMFSDASLGLDDDILGLEPEPVQDEVEAVAEQVEQPVQETAIQDVEPVKSVDPEQESAKIQDVEPMQEPEPVVQVSEIEPELQINIEEPIESKVEPKVEPKLDVPHIKTPEQTLESVCGADMDLVTVSPVEFVSFDSEDTHYGADPKGNIDILQDVKMHITVELGRAKSSVKKILDLNKGSIVELNKVAGEQVELYANGRFIAYGEVIVIEDKFGLRVTNTALQNIHNNI